MRDPNCKVEDVNKSPSNSSEDANKETQVTSKSIIFQKQKEKEVPEVSLESKFNLILNLKEKTSNMQTSISSKFITNQQEIFDI